MPVRGIEREEEIKRETLSESERERERERKRKRDRQSEVCDFFPLGSRSQRFFSNFELRSASSLIYCPSKVRLVPFQSEKSSHWPSINIQLLDYFVNGFITHAATCSTVTSCLVKVLYKLS